MTGRRPQRTRVEVGRGGWRSARRVVAVAVAVVAVLVATATATPPGGGDAARAGARAGAQVDGTPGASSGAGRDLLLQATLERDADGPTSLRLLRITLEDGGRSALHTHPGVEFGVVESGRLVVKVTGRAVTLPAEAGSAAGSEVVPEGVEVTLGPGDRIAYAAGTAMTFRNPGPEPTILLVATVLPAGPEAPPGAVYPGGTPTAEDAAGVTSQILGDAVAERLPSGRSAITLERLELAAGSGLPGYAGPVLVAVERGGLSGSVMRDEEARGGDEGESGATPAAESFRLVAGEAIFLAEGMAETPPLGGEGEVVLLRLGVIGLPEETETDADEAEAAAATDDTAEDDAEAAETPEAEADPEEIDEEATVEAADAADPTGIGDGARVVVAVAEARLRAAPTVEADVVAGLAEGQALTVVGPAEEDAEGRVWLPVEVEDEPGVGGFVAAELVVPEEEAG